MDANRRFLFVPNSVTAANIVVGFIAMIAAADGKFRLAVILLMVAILLDLADGRVARMLHATSKFGQEMDSLSDSLSFCAAPAFLVHQAVLRPLEGLGVFVAVSFVLAGVYRLARFNLISDEHQKASRTTGVPTPIAAGYMMALVLMRDQVPVPAAATVVLILALLMLSRWHLPEVQSRGWLGAAFGVGLLNYFALVAWPNWYTVGWWNVWNLVILAIAARTGTPDDEEDLVETVR
ncbi:MAG: CDP-diacylglycerol--serine O-phosphatidyltransferase [bacterium]|nr:CDP-diacylglycerol--serine O-phosphatidyltransferase [bacterium]